MQLRKLIIALTVTIACGAVLWGNIEKQASSGNEMAAAAQHFLSSLSDEQKKAATFAFTDKERLNWHYIPRERKGLPLKLVEGKALRAAHGLLQSGLSDAGYDQALNVMSLEEVLYLLEGGKREVRRGRRDPQKYYISIFGTPANSGTWGWRVEGHHLSLNYTLIDGKVVSSTPEFFGANPGLINAGPNRKIRVLGTEEDLARQILKQGSPSQQKLMWIDKAAPDDIRSRGTVQPERTAPVGLPVAKMSADQKKLMQSLLTEYLKNMPTDIEKERRTAINEAGHDNISIAWWGSSELNKRHGYRIQGPTFLVEYNNTQNSANHVHAIWRDIAGDFNVPFK